jgi:hypothetical protein
MEWGEVAQEDFQVMDGVGHFRMMESWKRSMILGRVF